MPAGIHIINDHDTILIDQNYHNLAIVDQATVTIPASGRATIPSAGVGEQIAIRSNGFCAAYLNQLVAPAGTVVTWFRFGRPTSLGFGLEVRDAAGKVTFDSGFKYARVAGTATANLVAGHTINLPSGRSYAILMARHSFNQQVTVYPYNPPIPPPPYAFDATVKISGGRTTSNEATIAWVQVAAFDNLGQPVSDPPSSFADTEFTAHVIDVTGY